MKESIGDINSSQSLFNLSTLEAIGDPDTTVEIISDFLTITPKELNEITIAFSHRNRQHVCCLAHKLKSSAAVLEATGFVQLLDAIEKSAKTEANDIELKNLVTQTVHEYSKLESALTGYLGKKK